MDAGLLAQYALIALAVLFSAGYVARRQFPLAVRRLRVSMAMPMVRDGQPPWLRRLGHLLAPPVQGTAGSCGGCNGCGPSE